MTNATTILTADVRAADQLDCLVVMPRDAKDRLPLSGALRAAFPEIVFRTTVAGITINAFDTGAIFRGSDRVDLRWTVEARQFAENRLRAKAVHQQVHSALVALREGGRPSAEPYLKGVQGLQVLDDHQWTNVAAMTLPDSPGLCLWDEQGAGKTVSTIYAFDTLVERDEADFALIVAPKSMVPEWQNDIVRFKDDLYRTVVATGDRGTKLAKLQAQPDVIVTNYETVVSLEDELRNMLRLRPGRWVLVVDESFFAKNLDAQRTRALRRLREWCGRCFVLCGTPAPNAPHDIVQQSNLVDFGLAFDGVQVPEDRAAAAPVVQRALDEKGLYIRHLKVDVLPELRAKQFERLIIPMEPEQQRLYDHFRDDLVNDLKTTDDMTFRRQVTSFLARRSALLQICSDPRSVVSDYNGVPAKQQALDSLLADLVGKRREKIVLWSFYTASINALCTRYAHYGAVRYDGTISDTQDRREAVRQFQEDSTTMLFIGNPAAAGAGLTLHRARYAVYESMSNQAAHYLQSLDRIHRRGQERDVEYIVLLCADSLEIGEYERLVRKEQEAQHLLRDHVDPPLTRETLLAELSRGL